MMEHGAIVGVVRTVAPAAAATRAATKTTTIGKTG